MWNSGGDGLCKEFKCKYYRKSLQCQRVCNDCAYSYKGNCKHLKKPKGFNQDNDTAKYCCFYFDIQKDRNKFILKKSHTIRRALTRELCSHTDSYNNKKRYIHENEKKLKKLPIDSREYKYLKSKLSEKERMANEEQEHINRLNEELSKLGGPLYN